MASCGHIMVTARASPGVTARQRGVGIRSETAGRRPYPAVRTPARQRQWRTHNPSVAGSSPARPAAFAQVRGHIRQDGPQRSSVQAAHWPQNDGIVEGPWTPASMAWVRVTATTNGAIHRLPMPERSRSGSGRLKKIRTTPTAPSPPAEERNQTEQASGDGAPDQVQDQTQKGYVRQGATGQP